MAKQVNQVMKWCAVMVFGMLSSSAFAIFVDEQQASPIACISDVCDLYAALGASSQLSGYYIFDGDIELDPQVTSEDVIFFQLEIFNPQAPAVSSLQGADGQLLNASLANPLVINSNNAGFVFLDWLYDAGSQSFFGGGTIETSDTTLHDIAFQYSYAASFRGASRSPVGGELLNAQLQTVATVVGDFVAADDDVVDGDGFIDTDNCLIVFNPTQLDVDNDGIGNHCDPDLNNDCVVDFEDLAMLKASFFSNDVEADLDGNGLVNFSDLALMKQLFFKPPGPSADTPEFCSG